MTRREDSYSMVPMLISYGGGHAAIMIALAQEFERRGHPYRLLGLTTAFATFQRAGLNPIDVTSLLDDDDRAFAAAVKPLLPPQQHPDVTYEQTLAYFSLGFRDLCETRGEREAVRLVRLLGRQAFSPVGAFERYFSAHHPSCVVTTTSPRFELAAQRAACRLSLPSVAVADLFLRTEREWVLQNDYAAHVTVLSEAVANALVSEGIPRHRVHALGNPAFDGLVAVARDVKRRERLRAELGLEGARVLLWPLGGSTDEVDGKRLLSATEAIRFLDGVCAKDRDLRYLVRPHPNWPVEDAAGACGVVDGKLTPEEALLVADVVCVESSTMGLQGVLMGKPVICYGFADYVHYPRLGWAATAGSLDEMERHILERTYFAPPEEAIGQVGGAATAIVDLIDRVAQRPAIEPRSPSTGATGRERMYREP